MDLLVTATLICLNFVVNGVDSGKVSVQIFDRFGYPTTLFEPGGNIVYSVDEPDATIGRYNSTVLIEDLKATVKDGVLTASVPVEKLDVGDRIQWEKRHATQTDHLEIMYKLCTLEQAIKNCKSTDEKPICIQKPKNSFQCPGENNNDVAKVCKYNKMMPESARQDVCSKKDETAETGTAEHYGLCTPLISGNITEVYATRNITRKTCQNMPVNINGKKVLIYDLIPVDKSNPTINISTPDAWVVSQMSHVEIGANETDHETFNKASVINHNIWMYEIPSSFIGSLIEERSVARLWFFRFEKGLFSVSQFQDVIFFDRQKLNLRPDIAENDKGQIQCTVKRPTMLPNDKKYYVEVIMEQRQTTEEGTKTFERSGSDKLQDQTSRVYGNNTYICSARLYFRHVNIRFFEILLFEEKEVKALVYTTTTTSTTITTPSPTSVAPSGSSDSGGGGGGGTTPPGKGTVSDDLVSSKDDDSKTEKDENLIITISVVIALVVLLLVAALVFIVYLIYFRKKSAVTTAATSGSVLPVAPSAPQIPPEVKLKVINLMLTDKESTVKVAECLKYVSGQSDDCPKVKKLLADFPKLTRQHEADVKKLTAEGKAGIVHGQWYRDMGILKETAILDSEDKPLHIVKTEPPEDQNTHVTKSKTGVALGGNFITNLYGEKRFIMTEAPRKGNVQALLRCIVRDMVKVVVTIGTEADLKNDRIFPYFHPNSGVPAGFYKIEFIGNPLINNKTVEVRTLNISSTNDANIHQFYHIFYKKWMDYAAANDFTHISVIKSFIDQVFNKQPMRDATILVHCSAGVGRSGTLIAGFLLIDKLNCHCTEVNVPAVVAHVRKYRLFSVQKQAQYETLFKVVGAEYQAGVAHDVAKLNVLKDKEISGRDTRDTSLRTLPSALPSKQHSMKGRASPAVSKQKDTTSISRESSEGTVYEEVNSSNLQPAPVKSSARSERSKRKKAKNFKSPKKTPKK